MKKTVFCNREFYLSRPKHIPDILAFRLGGMMYFSRIFTLFQKQPPEVFYTKKVFLEISQNSQENACARVSFLIKLQA